MSERGIYAKKGDAVFAPVRTPGCPLCGCRWCLRAAGLTPVCVAVESEQDLRALVRAAATGGVG